MTIAATPQQQTAIQTQDRALLVEAGAGTGKTWVLVQRYLHLLEQHPDWPIEALVAVTFTEKAAREMRTRIRRQVEQAARVPGAPESGAEPHWQARRRQLERMQVSTIHSLCARLLRENAIAAGIDPQFSVLDEQQAGLLKEEALRQALDDLVQSDSPGLELLASLQVRDLRRELELLLSQRGVVQRLFASLETPEQLLARWRAGLAEMRAATWAELLRTVPLLDQALQSVPQLLITDEADKLAPAVGYAQRGCHFQAVGNLAAAGAEWANIRRTGGKADNWGGKDALAEIKLLLQALQVAAKDLESSGCLQEIGPLDEQAAQALTQWQAVWQVLARGYNRLKAERSALDFDDLELLTEELLYRQPRPARLQATLDGLHHLMVDEFQDTNPIQQRIVYALAPPETPGRLFVVGDAKQSIYRFRQAQVTIFNQTAQDIQRLSGQPPVALSRSFRTQAALLAALNHLFAHLLIPLGASYADFEARPGPLQASREAPDPHTAAPAPVEILLLPATDLAGERISAADLRIFEAQRLAQRLLALQAAGFPVWDARLGAYRPFRFEDAAILFRATTSLPLYEEQFKVSGLPYLTVSGRGYYDRPEIQDLLALLAALDNPGDDLSLASALRSPLFSLSDESLYRLRWRTPQDTPATRPRPYTQALSAPPPCDQAEQVTFARQTFSALWALTGRVPVWRLLRTALDQTGYEATLALSDLNGNGRQRSNLLKLVEIARQQGSTSLAAFLRGLQDLRAREAREGEALGGTPQSGAVQLMSIHAAKGLEFPVVVVPDLGRTPGGGFGSPHILHDPAYGLVCKLRNADGEWQMPAGYAWARWLHERMEAAEARRLLYVACTRAADLLILSGRPGNKGDWMNAVMEAWQIETSGPEMEERSFPDFSVQVLRPEYAPVDLGARTEPTAQRNAGLAAIPMLALPLPSLAVEGGWAVTRLVERLSAEEGKNALPEIRPAVWEAAAPGSQVPAFLVGRMLHRALADWNCLALPDEVLQARLVAFARREGLLEPEAIDQAVGRLRRWLADLRRSPLYSQVSAAVQRHSEVPFSLRTEAGELQGVIDLLFQDSQQHWHLIDWKTDQVLFGTHPGKPGLAEGLETQLRQHLWQLAVYRQAAQRILGMAPRVSVCFLSSGARLVSYTDQELQAAWQSLIAQAAS